jgi:hypothetical protein
MPSRDCANTSPPIRTGTNATLAFGLPAEPTICPPDTRAGRTRRGYAHHMVNSKDPELHPDSDQASDAGQLLSAESPER